VCPQVGGLRDRASSRRVAGRSGTVPRGTTVGSSARLAVLRGGGGRLLTVPEVAEELQVCRATVYRIVEWASCLLSG
jgi:hypothetical protein